MSFERDNQITQPFTIGELSEHPCKKLIPASQVLDIAVTVVLGNDAIEPTPIKKCD